jgi:Tol biopolymer transport system component
MAGAISPDGKYLAYSDETGVYLRLIDSGERHSLTIPVGLKVFHLAWFPDGNKLLASAVVERERASSLWTISILGGHPVKVRDDVKLASVSPDGSQIAFVSGGGKEIWLMAVVGGEPRRLLSDNGNSNFRCLVWFPNGQRLGYVRASLENNRMEVESCDLKGGSVTQIFSKLWVGDLSVLPDGKMIYSTARTPWTSSGEPEADLKPLKQSEGSVWEIRTDMRTGSAVSRPRRIISWPGFMVPNLSASRDGKRLIFRTPDLSDFNRRPICKSGAGWYRGKPSPTH